ncbi:unnamed protein product [Cylindrotheca closterium]|uniref:Transmembrane and coiled-coil domain-containing protein 4 n=1 Tax=Cylindrotheca closterium TaxID=2856 RepID=A0AAD2FJD8_9STRA|nr:unnamed protein product [Cylindrotheca closterium]
MDLSESKIYLCLVALCCGPTQEDADFLRSLGTLLKVPQTEQASCITMLTAVSQSSNPFQMAEELALKLRENIDQNTALEKFCMLFLICFYPLQVDSSAKNQRQTEKLYQHVQFNAKTSVIFRRLAFLLRIKLSTVTKLEAMAIEQWKELQDAAATSTTTATTTDEDDSAISATTSKTSSSTSSTSSSKRSRRKGVIRGLKIGATAAGAGVLLGVTGGLAAPALAAGLAHIGLGAAATFTTTASVAAILGTGGAGLAGYKMNRRLKVVHTFEFQAINNQHLKDSDKDDKEKKGNENENATTTTGMTVYVCVTGYLRSPGPAPPKLKKNKKKNRKGDKEQTSTTIEEEGEESASPSKQSSERRGWFGRKGSQNSNDTNSDMNNIASSAEKTDSSEGDIPAWMAPFTDDTPDDEGEGGKKRRGFFGRGRNNSQDSNASSEKPKSQSIMAARSSAYTSPEFYEPWGAQPPVMFPRHVLDRYYAVVAPDKRFLVPMLIQKYRKKYKREQRRLRKQASSSGGGGGDSDDGSADLDDMGNSTDYLPKSSGLLPYDWNNTSDDELDAEIDYGLTPDDQDIFVDSTSCDTDPDGNPKGEIQAIKETADEKLFALLEQEYGVHPLQIMEAAEKSRKEQEEMAGSTAEMYRSLLQKGQARMESLLTVGHSSDKKPKKDGPTDLLNDPIEHQHLVEMMNYQRPWDKVFTMEDRQKDTEVNAAAAASETISTTISDPDGNQEDVLIKLDEDNTDEEKVNKIIEDLNNLFEEIDEASEDTNTAKSTGQNSDQSTHEKSLNEEMQKLEIDTNEGRKGFKFFDKNKVKSLEAKAENATDIYWWRESVARTGDQYTLVWEPSILLDCGRCVENLVKESAAKGALSALQFTALAPIIMTMTLPVVILSVVTLLDNYWSMATAAADEAGELLADALLSGAHGNRPVVLVGYSVGGRVVASCLRSLARVAESRDDRDDDEGEAIDEPEIGGESAGGKNPASSAKQQRDLLRDFMANTKARRERAKTIVRDAVIIGAPLDCNTRRWTRRRSVVQGRLINVYNSKDWVLALLYRYKSWSVVKLAGLQPVECSPIDGLPSIENYNVSDIVTGHDKYHTKIREILDLVGVGDVNCEHAHSHYFSTDAVEILKEEPTKSS